MKKLIIRLEGPFAPLDDARGALSHGRRARLARPWLTRGLATLLVLTTGEVVSLTAQNPIPVGARIGSERPSGYDDLGRRDPFVCLVTPKKVPGTTAPTKPGSGLVTIAVGDIVVTGIIRAGAEPIAILQGPDGKSFTTKVGDHLRDGVIRRIEAGGVVFLQQEEDALGALHPKETRKAIRSEGAGR